MKKALILGLSSGILSGIAAVVYNHFYSEALVVDFSAIAKTPALLGSSIFGCVLASLGYFFFTKVVKNNPDPLFNAIFLILSFASFAGPFSAPLPLDTESPELFVGLTIPMHLFPPLFWMALKPLIYKSGNAQTAA